MNKTSTYIVIGIVLLAFALVFFAGYKMYPKKNPCPQIESDTVYLHDTVIHEIYDTIPYYIIRVDTVIQYEIIYENVDSSVIIERWLYSYEIYDREWNDSLITVTLKDTIFQNEPIGCIFNYKILRPQTVIHNTINKVTRYDKYIITGFDMTVLNPRYSEIEAMYVWGNGMLGIGYTPEVKSFNIKMGIPIVRFKK